MKIWMGCVAALWLCASSARAADVADPEWSIGAGLGYGFGSLQGIGSDVFGGSSIGYLSTTTLSPTLSLERRVAPGTWLLLGAAASFHKQTAAPTPGVSSSYYADTKQGGGTLAFGVRHFLTEPGAVIGVSVHGAAEVGAYSLSADRTNSDGAGSSTTSHASVTAWSVGALGGIALDKRLLDQLTLRLAVQLFSVAYTKATTSPSETVQGGGSSFDASLLFSPDLELRFAF